MSKRASLESAKHACCLPHQPSGSGGAVSIRTRHLLLQCARTISAVRSVEASSSTIDFQFDMLAK